MKERTLERIKKFLDYKGISNRAFEVKFGFSNGSFASQLKNGKTIGVDRLENILREYREINIEWLLIGEGEMLRAEQTKADTEPTIVYRSDPRDAKIITLQEEKIKMLEDKLAYHTAVLRDAPAADTPVVGGVQALVNPRSEGPHISK